MRPRAFTPDKAPAKFALKHKRHNKIPTELKNIALLLTLPLKLCHTAFNYLLRKKFRAPVRNLHIAVPYTFLDKREFCNYFVALSDIVNIIATVINHLMYN